MKHLKGLMLAATAVLALSALVGASSASATTLQSGGKNLPTGTEIVSTLAPGTSSIVKDKHGTTNDTCTGSENKGKTTNETGAVVTGVGLHQTTSGCSHTTDSLSVGNLSISWTSGLNGTVSSNGSELTVKSTVFGISAVCKTGTGTVIGTLTGVTSGHATIDMNATTVDCGALGTSSWTGIYVVTSPTGLSVVK
jgi:hypothetical protein